MRYRLAFGSSSLGRHLWVEYFRVCVRFSKAGSRPLAPQRWKISGVYDTGWGGGGTRILRRAGAWSMSSSAAARGGGLG